MNSFSDQSGPVAPTTEEHGYNSGVPGMTMLQYYAGKAMLAILSNPNYHTSPEALAKNCFIYAESMIKHYESLKP